MDRSIKKKVKHNFRTISTSKQSLDDMGNNCNNNNDTIASMNPQQMLAGGHDTPTEIQEQEPTPMLDDSIERCDEQP